jgi:cytochrome P450
MASIYTAQLFTPEELRSLSQADPQAAHSEMAAKCPFHRGPDGTVTITRAEDVIALCKRPDVLGPGAQGATMGGKRPLPPVDFDGAEHTKYRRMLDPLFSAKRMAALEPLVRKLADELINKFIDKGECDLQDDFCQPLPSILFLSLMGLPASDLEQFLSFKNIILGHLPPGMPLPQRMALIRDASERCYAYMTAEVDARTARAEHGDNLIGWLLDAEIDGVKLPREKVIDICYVMVIAGLDTVASALTCLFARLARAPELRKRLVAEPALWASAVEELLRYESPVPRTFRTATQDLEVAGEKIAAGTTFFLSWASANLDEEAFADPLAIDPERKPNPHLAFGSGFHRCVGVALGRMEMRAALDQFHKRLPDYQLKPGHELVFTGMPRFANALPIVWEPGKIVDRQSL